jgi:NADPH:quinone reductase-like Zn-dependent oxidoreductase
MQIPQPGRIESVPRVDIRRLYRRHLSILGDRGASAQITREVWHAVSDRRVEPAPVHHCYPLAEAAAAHVAAASRDTFGRVTWRSDSKPA